MFDTNEMRSRIDPGDYSDQDVFDLCDEIDILQRRVQVLETAIYDKYVEHQDFGECDCSICKAAKEHGDKCPTCGRIGDPACKTVGCPD